MTRALIVVDLQRDFCEGGSLPVAGGSEVARRVTGHLAAHRGDYAVVVATRDHHVDPGAHFATEPDYVDTWPSHCVVGTAGAEFQEPFSAVVQEGLVDAVFDKGAHAAAYSGFEGATAAGEGLAGWLRDRGVTEVDVVGLATDHCVRATALDAAVNGFATTVVEDLAAGVAPDTTARARAQLAAAGVFLGKSAPEAPEGRYDLP